jgi:hypothetical protein
MIPDGGLGRFAEACHGGNRDATRIVTPERALSAVPIVMLFPFAD